MRRSDHQTIRTKNAVEFKSSRIIQNAGKKGRPNQQLERENAANQRKKKLHETGHCKYSKKLTVTITY